MPSTIVQRPFAILGHDNVVEFIYVRVDLQHSIVSTIFCPIQ